MTNRSYRPDRNDPRYRRKERRLGWIVLAIVVAGVWWWW